LIVPDGRVVQERSWQVALMFTAGTIGVDVECAEGGVCVVDGVPGAFLLPVHSKALRWRLSRHQPVRLLEQFVDLVLVIRVVEEGVFAQQGFTVRARQAISKRVHLVLRSGYFILSGAS